MCARDRALTSAEAMGGLGRRCNRSAGAARQPVKHLELQVRPAEPQVHPPHQCRVLRASHSPGALGGAGPHIAG